MYILHMLDIVANHFLVTVNFIHIYPSTHHTRTRTDSTLKLAQKGNKTQNKWQSHSLLCHVRRNHGYFNALSDLTSSPEEPWLL